MGANHGVHRVLTGHAVQEGSQYRHCWLVRFSGQPVILSYRQHPAHKRFADERFRPYAGDRVSINIEETLKDIKEGLKN
ncbi:MAG: Dabb family protein [Gammaproteobacteria bacterium]|nr:Dabb family protein [Gammaproteobacteria bacterium]